LVKPFEETIRCIASAGFMSAPRGGFSLLHEVLDHAGSASEGGLVDVSLHIGLS
jgi:hypothetical protein